MINFHELLINKIFFEEVIVYKLNIRVKLFFTPNSTLLMEKALEFPEESGADLLLREQRILNYIKSLNQKEREEV